MTTTSESADSSYAVSVFIILANEDTRQPAAIAQQKIRRKLRRLHLGAYAQTRVDVLRQLRDELCAEISKFERSIYFLKIEGLKFAESRQFDYERMVADLSKSYPAIDPTDLRGIVGYALYFYYLR